jgi:hypothetical protein
VHFSGRILVSQRFAPSDGQIGDWGRVADQPPRIVASGFKVLSWEYNDAHRWSSPLARSSARTKSSLRSAPAEWERCTAPATSGSIAPCHIATADCIGHYGQAALIPKDYYDSTLADTVWFELTPEESPEMIEDDPDEKLIASITPDVIGALQEKGFFAALDEMFCHNRAAEPQTCSGDFHYAKQALQLCGFEESDWSDVFHVLMGQGAFCDCEILYNAATESRLKTQYWQRRSHEKRN